ncbi:hypothetical protein RND71_023670 [Anisodus tanguticus]|uniref:GCK domain-containing protein n=1 Tax=Anisodus tanguticus TaxID=243964 RepID=A0AAE1VEZ3_9SOLA|nr:hypothetical protein RND71_023670 [Anisodus tanguticus]
MRNFSSRLSDSNPSSPNSPTMSSSQAHESKSKIEPTHESKPEIEPTHESKPKIEPTHQPETSKTQNPKEENQEQIGENNTALGDNEEEEEEGECGFCLFMKGGGCKDSFIEWEKCIEEGEKNKEDIVEKCFEVTSALKKCMEVHSDYYASILQAEKAAQDDLEKEKEKEKVQENESNDTGPVRSDTKLEGSSNSS